MQTRDVEWLMDKQARLAGLSSKVTPHTLRHTLTTRFLRDGGDLATLQMANLMTTARHLHPDAGQVQQRAEDL